MVIVKTRCKVCSSKNRAIYEDLRLNKKYTFVELEKKARELGESIGKDTFCRHFNLHVRDYIEEQVEALTKKKAYSPVEDQKDQCRDKGNKSLKFG